MNSEPTMQVTDRHTRCDGRSKVCIIVVSLDCKSTRSSVDVAISFSFYVFITLYVPQIKIIVDIWSPFFGIIVAVAKKPLL